MWSLKVGLWSLKVINDHNLLVVVGSVVKSITTTYLLWSLFL